MIRVNLLSAGPAAPRTRILVPVAQRSTLLGLFMLLATAGGVGAWSWSLGRDTAELDATIARNEADLVRLKSVAQQVDRAVARKAELSEKLALIDRLRTAQHGPVHLLSTVSESLTDGLWLMELKQQGATVQMEGRAMSLTAVTDFVERLQSTGIFDRPVEIVTTSMEAIEDVSVVRFAIRAQDFGTAAAAAAAAKAAPPVKGK